MRKLILFALSLVFVVSATAQERVMLPLTRWSYANGNKYTHSVGDSIANAAIDTMVIGVIGPGRTAPVAVNLHFHFKGVGGTKDSVNVTYQVGIGDTFFTTVGSAQTEAAASITTTGLTATRTFVFNTTGADAALNTQAAVFPHGTAIRLFITQASNDSETISYRVRAYGIYEK